MENIKKLLDAAKQRGGITSDYALAKILDLPTQRISDYYKGTRQPNAWACLKIADFLGRPLAEVITAAELDAEKDEKRRAVWRKYYKSLGGVAATVAVAVLLNVTFEVSPAGAEPLYMHGSSVYAICIM